MLHDVTESDIEIGASANTWEDAIKTAARPLIARGDVTPGYVDAMIDAVHRVGPYIVLCRGVALAHARPEHGVMRGAVHFTTFPDGVRFGKEDFDPIRLVITLAAEDDTSHLDLMAELAGILMDEENIDALVACDDAKAFSSLLSTLADED